jgi:Xaa-Pro dipeptidase
MHELMRAREGDTLGESSMRQDVIDRQAQAMKAAGLDAILSCSPENFAYVTGFLSPTQKLMRWRHAMALVTADGTAALVVVDMEASTIRARAGEGVEIAVWGEFAFEAMKVAADLLRRHGLAEARIGLELDYLPAADFAELAALLPSAKFSAAQTLLARLRQIKTPNEIDLLRRLSRIADRGIAAAYDAVGAGATEMDIAAALNSSVYE